MNDLIITPNGWNRYQLGHIGVFTNGINKSKVDFGFGVPFINLLDIFAKPIVEKRPEGLVNATDSEIKNYVLRKGDVLFVRSSVKPEGVGLTTVVYNNLDGVVYSGFIVSA